MARSHDATGAHATAKKKANRIGWPLRETVSSLVYLINNISW